MIILKATENMNKIIKNSIISSLKPSIKVIALFFGGIFSIPILFMSLFSMNAIHSIFISSIILIASFVVGFIIKLIYNLTSEIAKLESELINISATQQQASMVEYPYVFIENKRVSKLELNRETLMLDEKSVWTLKVKILTEETSHTRHQLGKGDKFFINNFNLEMKIKSLSGHKVFIRDDRKDAGMYRWHVCFSETLKRGDIVEYEMEYCVKNKFFIYDKDLSLALSSKVISQLNNNTDFMNRTSSCPAEKLSTTIIFPDKFILPFAPQINVEKRHIKLPEETNRIKTDFKYDGNEKKIFLLINKPLVDCSYKIEWKLPSIEELLESGFIDEKEAGRLVNRKDFNWN